MKHISLLCLIIFCICYGQISAQCDNTLVDKAVLQSGPTAVYLRDFKVKFDGTEKGKAVPTAKYPVLLSKNTTYRFNVANAKEFEGKVILQLYLKDKLIGSTYNLQAAEDLQYFDFICDRAATYEVVMYFDRGKPGCAVGVLSMLTEKVVEVEDEEVDILYASADNPITIYDDEDDFAQIELSIDNGYVMKADRTSYIMHPQEPGTALLTIRVRNRNGTLKEFKQKRFAVLTLDKPYATVRGVRDGKVNKQELIKFGQLELWFSTDIKCNYRIISFTLSDKDDLISGISSNSGKLSKSQKKWINSRPSGTHLYIKNIQIRTSGHVVTNITPLKFEIE